MSSQDYFNGNSGMKKKYLVWRVNFYLFLLMCSNIFYVFEAKAQTINQTPIPFRQDSIGFGEQSLMSLSITVLLLILVIAGLYRLRQFLRKKFPNTLVAKTLGVVDASERIVCKDRLRINSKLDIYVLEYREEEILFAHGVGKLLQLTPYAKTDLKKNNDE